jgi:hypothetical protein
MLFSSARPFQFGKAVDYTGFPIVLNFATAVKEFFLSPYIGNSSLDEVLQNIGIKTTKVFCNLSVGYALLSL